MAIHRERLSENRTPMQALRNSGSCTAKCIKLCLNRS